MSRSEPDQAFEALLLDKLYLGYIDLEECTTFGRCDAAGVHALNNVLRDFGRTIQNLYTSGVSASFKQKFFSFATALHKQMARIRSQSPRYNCNVTTSSMPEPVWVAACSLLRLSATSVLAPASDCGQRFQDEVEPFLVCSECSNELVFRALATAMDDGHCVPKSRVMAAAAAVMKRSFIAS